MRYHASIVTPGSRFGPYEIGGLLGAGGMGEVYRARDTRLQRDVALKFLPESFAADPERLGRFTREAQTLAALSHPHIAHVHGLEESGAVRALVMEFVDGETLASRIARGRLGVDEALPIAREIADALEAAHAKGIVHRDLKPANVMLTRDGQVKVLDFGLAKAVDPRSGVDVANSPTLTLQATAMGVILGTAAYMSPEQARGRAVDKRTDVWAFGCVLYEMVTGKRAFDGEDATETIAAVVRAEPDWSALPESVPEQIRLLLKRCLEKDPRTRVSDVAVARFLMTETLTPVAPAPARSSRKNAIAAAAGVLAGAAIAAAATFAALKPSPGPRLSPVQFSITPSDPPLALFGFSRDVSISADGSMLVYRAGMSGVPALAIRPMGSLQVRLLPAAGGRDPFFSPDGQWIGYFLLNELRKVSVTGGPSMLVQTLSGNARGGSWGSDDRIVFAAVTQQRDEGLLSVAANGGDLKVLTRRAPGEGPHWDPFVLPGGRGVLYTIMPERPGDNDGAQIAVVDLRSGTSKTIARGATAPAYLPSGHLVFANGATLSAAPFDLDRLDVTGPALPVLDGVMSGPNGVSNYALSRDGALVYVPAISTIDMPRRSLVWVTRQGKEEPIAAPERPYAIPRVSPDGTRIALDIRESRTNSEIWIWDLARRTLAPLDLNPGQDLNPVWTPDSRRVIWSSSRAGGNPNLFWQSADGTGPVERLTTAFPAQFASSVTPDGSQVLMFYGTSATDPGLSTDLGTVALTPAPDGGKPQVALMQSAANKLNPEVSPDGRWLAYQSNESGQAQIYVRPYPAIDRGRTLISTTGGTRPVWSRNGRELFYLDGNDLLTSVIVQATASGLQVGTPKRILEQKYYAGMSSRGYMLRGYDISPDGERFLMLKESSAQSSAPPAPPSIVVILNWQEEVRTRVAAKR